MPATDTPATPATLATPATVVPKGGTPRSPVGRKKADHLCPSKAIAAAMGTRGDGWVRQCVASRKRSRRGDVKNTRDILPIHALLRSARHGGTEGGRAAEGETLDDADTTMQSRPMVMAPLLRGHGLAMAWLWACCSKKSAKKCKKSAKKCKKSAKKCT